MPRSGEFLSLAGCQVANIASVSRQVKQPPTAASSADPRALANLVFALYEELQVCKAVDPEGPNTNEVFRVLYRLATGRFPERPSMEPSTGASPCAC